MPLDHFHPAVRDWFNATFEGPTPIQTRGWAAVREGHDTLIAAPTGSGKTLAAFLAAIDQLAQQAAAGELGSGVQIVYVSPLRALSNDIERNLQAPLAAINARLQAAGATTEIRAGLRTGDTASNERARMTRRPPHILVSTPESLYILLSSEGGRQMLATARTVIVDEIHAVAPDRRGAHLALSLERLDDLVGAPLVRVGLSATQKPIELVASYLTGARRPAPVIVDAGHARDLDLAVEVTGSPLSAVMSAEHMEEIYDRLAELIEAHTTTLVFANTRREAERYTANLESRIGVGLVTSHHGALSRERRFEAEQALKDGRLRAIVATASLELGIDVGAVDLVCQVGSVRAISTLLQRVGRSGHHLGGTPRGRVFPLTLDELVEATALVDAVRRGELDRLIIQDAPLDILAQQIVAALGTHEWTEEALFDRVRAAHNYRDLPRERFEHVLAMLADGFSTRRGRRGAHIHWDQVNGRIRGRRGARLTALTSGGAIPDRADYRVVLDHDETFIGTLDEDFAIESMPGDIFQLGNTSWLIERIDSRNGQVRVHDARGKPPTIPFWFGEAPARTRELSHAVSRVRSEVEERLQWADDGILTAEAVRWATTEVGLDHATAAQLVGYLAAGREALGVMPTAQTIVVERFFDEAENTHLVLHSPFGSRVNRAWGLALRKRFCRSFNFELQAAANEDAIILSMGPTHSFPLEEVFDFLSSTRVRDTLVQALLDAPMFGTRWRWNLNRSLAVPRFQSGRKVPAPLQRMQAEDLLAVVFPDQLACLENIVGEREIPDHPLVQQTIRDCLEDAMDIDTLEQILDAIERNEITTVARDLREPSPLAHQVINARPYAFLDPAPLEERRTAAIQTRGLLDPRTVGDLAALDPAAVDRVREELELEARDPDELHDALVCRGYLTDLEVRDAGALPLAEALSRAGRAAHLPLGAGLWIAAERSAEFAAVFPEHVQASELRPPARFAREWDAHSGLTEILRSRLEFSGPITTATFAEELRLDATTVEATLLGLEASGFVFRGKYDTRVDADQWCERSLLARIHRYTLARLRREIQPVTPAEFMRFLFVWQRVAPTDHATGPDGLAAVLEQLSGVAAPAAVWETDILPARVGHYDPAWLDMACLSGRFVWGRFVRGGGRAPVRSSPITLALRGETSIFSEGGESPELSSAAAAVHDALVRRGPSFFADLATECRLLHTQAEGALAELVAAGIATADSFAGLRALLVPQSKRPAAGARQRQLGGVYAVDSAGRWSLLAPPADGSAVGPSDADVERLARRLLARWGVVVRIIARRESSVGWRRLLAVLRTMEARGEVRGGRFVTGVGGEQFALPEAVATLRRVRRADPRGELVALSAADPLNLTGVLLGDARVAAIANHRIIFRDGVPVAALEGREIRYLGGTAADADVERALRRLPHTPRLLSRVR